MAFQPVGRRTARGLPVAIATGLAAATLSATPAFAAPTPIAYPGVTYVVNSAADPGAGGCDAAECTLREAIAASQTSAGADSIQFAIGSGQQTITLATNLPAITQALVIDATTQPGFAGTPIVELTGTTTINAGLSLMGSSGSFIRGLVINGFARGIAIQGGGSNTIAGNYLGTNVAGTATAPGFNFGNIEINGSTDNLIGGPTADARNLISGFGSGVFIWQPTSTGNTVQNNYMGTNAAGTARIGAGPMTRVWIQSGSANTIVDNVLVADSGNTVEISLANNNTVTGNRIGTDAAGTTPLLSTGRGVMLNSAAGNTIGGAAPADGNVIAGGVSIHSSGANNNLIRHNSIGTDVTGALDLSDATRSGIDINGGDGNTVSNNTIAFNAHDGVEVVNGAGNTISQNSITANGAEGIDLWFAANDANDADGGPNNGQNHPVLSSVTTTASSTAVSGALDSTPGRSYRIEAFDNVACDGTGRGEGRTYLGAGTVTTDGSGHAVITFVAPATATGTVSATATDLTTGDTSEFSPCTTATAAPTNTAPVAADDAYSATAGVTKTVAAPGVLANDTDGDGDSLSASAGITSAEGGTVTMAADGGFDYSPPAGFTGSDTFTYTASDGTDVDAATVTMTVNAAPPLDTDGDGVLDGTDPAPLAGISACAAGSTAPVALGVPVSGAASFTGDVTAAALDWGDGTPDLSRSSAGSLSGTHTYAAAGVYVLTCSVTDTTGGTQEQRYRYVVVYDPSAGFVTGGGWIDSPAGAYVPDPSLTGKASFGFVAKYKKGASVPTGNTEFVFSTAGMSFDSGVYQWLVVSGSKAQFKGVGTINGAGAYGFLLTASDSAVRGGESTDAMRIKIWDSTSGAVVYDNKPGAGEEDTSATTPLSGGSIVVHKS